MKTFTEYFGVKTEQLDIYNDVGRVLFTSYTEKVANGAGAKGLAQRCAAAHIG
jgi:hypothetical protein